MVGPVSEDDRRRVNRQVAAGFVLLVAGSAGLTAFYGGASAAEVGAIAIAGVLAGAVLLWIVVS